MSLNKTGCHHEDLFISLRIDSNGRILVNMDMKHTGLLKLYISLRIKENSVETSFITKCFVHCSSSFHYFLSDKSK
jgi:hypothetical protein